MNPVRNSSRASNAAGIILGPNPAVGGITEQRGIISNGVNASLSHLHTFPFLKKIFVVHGGEGKYNIEK